MSLMVVGGNSALDLAVRQSIATGVTYVIAAGNDNADAGFYSPARVTEALTVGATDSSDTRAQFFSGSGSNYGSVLDLFALGKFILSAWYDTDVSTSTISGTSMAAPHVAGVAALYLQSNPGASPATVNQAIINSATLGKVIDPGPGSPNRLLYSIFNSAHDNRADFDGNYKTDISVFNQNTGEWRSRNISNNQDVSFYFGQSGDIPTTGDYNGDGKTDYAVFRPSNTIWYILNSRDNSVAYVQFGLSDDRLVPGDYDGDARADVAVFRPSNSTWYIRRADGSFYGVQFGVTSDWPVQADYNGDGLTDIAIFQPSTGYWYVRWPDGTFYGGPLGGSGDRPVPGDYDGDGKADFAVQRAGTGTWYIYNSATGTYTIVNPCSTFLNSCSEFPVPGGYLTPLY